MNSCSLERSFLIRFANGDNDATLKLRKGSLVEDLITKLRLEKGWSTDKNIRLIAAGHELLPHVCIDRITGGTLHCSVSDQPPSKTRQVPSSTVQDSTDWLDRTSPAFVFMGVFGVVLTFLWSLWFLQNSSDPIFDDSGVGLLTLLTLVFLFPCFTFYAAQNSINSNTSTTIGHTSVPGLTERSVPTDERHASLGYGYQSASRHRSQTASPASTNS